MGNSMMSEEDRPSTLAETPDDVSKMHLIRTRLIGHPQHQQAQDRIGRQQLRVLQAIGECNLDDSRSHDHWRKCNHRSPALHRACNDGEDAREDQIATLVQESF